MKKNCKGDECALLILAYNKANSFTDINKSKKNNNKKGTSATIHTDINI